MSGFRYARTVAVLAAAAVGLSAVATSAHMHPALTFNSSLKRSAAARHTRVARKHARSIVHKMTVRAKGAPAVQFPVLVDADLGGKDVEMDDGVGGNGANLYPYNVNANNVLLQPQDTVNFPNDTLYGSSFLKLGSLIQAPPQDTISNIDSLAVGGNPTVLDWVRDTLPQGTYGTDVVPGTLISALAEGVITTGKGVASNGDNAQTGVIDPSNPVNGTARGHWYGQRIVDGIPGIEQDIFKSGGKENTPDSWIIGAGSVGSAKYDITQCYLANTSYPTTDLTNFGTDGTVNQLLFAMERRGNDGTTAFDFEFDQQQPKTSYIPNRTDGDVLFTFEMQGSSTNIAKAHIYIYKNGQFDLTKDYADPGTPQNPNPLFLGVYSPRTSMNFGATPSEPWGHVDSKGNWSTVAFDNAEFCEALAFYGPDTITPTDPTGILANVAKCGGVAYVQIRTRSSVTQNSDLKDTTKFFEFKFPSPTAKAKDRTQCSPSFFIDGSDSTGSSPGASLKYDWTLVPSDPNVTLSYGGSPLSKDANGFHTPQFTNGTEREITVTGMQEGGVDITPTLKVTEGANCSDSKTLAPIHVSTDLGAGTPTLTGSCNTRTLNFSGLITGGQAPINYEWDVYNVNDMQHPVYTLPGTSQTIHVSTSGSFTPTTDGTYVAILNGYDARFDPTKPLLCAVHPPSANVCAFGDIAAAASKLSADGDKQTVSLSGSFLDVSASCGSSSIQWQVQLPDGSWKDIPGANSKSFTYSNFQTDDTAPVVSGPVTINGVSYMIKTFTVMLHAHVERNINGQKCSEDSAAVPVKFILAVDP